MSGRNKSVGFAVLSIVLVLTAGLVVSGCGGGAAPKPGKVYKVTFEASGGEPVPEAQFVEAGNKIELPKTMARTKFTFSGWYKDLDCKEPWDFAKDTVEGDIILFANWKSTAGKSGGGGGGSSGGGGGGGGNNAPAPIINIQPVKASYLVGDTADPLTITATGSGVLSYQWYSNATNSASGGTPVGTDAPSFTPGIPIPPITKEDTYYYCIVTNTDASVTGNKTASKTSDVVLIAARNGDPDSLIVIDSKELLKKIGTAPYGLDLCYELTEDIDMSTVLDFEPIGSMSDPFEGVFEGNGHIIKNLTINPISPAGEGMFSVVGYYGCDLNLYKYKVTGVTLVDCKLNCGNALTAGLVGQNYGTVEYCNVIRGTITGSFNVGGVVGYNFGKVQNCYVMASSVTGDNNVGGVVGSNPEGSVQNCYAGVNVSSLLGTIGGVVGYNGAVATVTNCYAMGSVEGSSQVGGVVGNNLSGTVQNCVALNTSVTATTATIDIGRVAGITDNLLSSNYARDDLIPVTTGGSWPNGPSGGSTIDGEDLEVDDSRSLSGYVFSGWNTAVWEIPDGKLIEDGPLPTLKPVATWDGTPPNQEPKLPTIP